METAHQALLTLTLTDGVGPRLIRRAVEKFGDPLAALAAPAASWAQIEGIGLRKAQEICAAMQRVKQEEGPAREMEAIELHGVTLLALEDEGYPRLLRHIPDPPPLLYVRGELREDDAVALAVVGARQCTHYGREQADRLAALAAQSGLCIVSGGAYGVDAAAHHAALRVGGRTIAVLGCGLAQPYPSDHMELFDQIASGRGAVASELPMATPPLAQHFPRRNRIISGLSLGVLVVEAALRSGALITARLAVEEHGREVMALPGRVDSPVSAGCHKIIREGWATLVTNLDDILDAMGETGQLLKTGAPRSYEADMLAARNLTDTQRQIVEAMSQPRTLDQLSADTGLAVQVLQADLTMLAIRGVIVRQDGHYVRKR